MQMEEESTFEPVEKLQQFGINASDIQKLKDGGYYTIGMVLKTPQKVSNGRGWKCKDLVNGKGLSEAKIEKILNVAHTMKVVSMESSSVDGGRVLHRKGDANDATSKSVVSLLC